MDPLKNLNITPEILRLIAELDEFKGRWQASSGLPVERLSGLRRVATIESVAGAVAATGANRNTIKSQLRKLVEARRLTRHGRGRGTWYEAAPAVRS